MLKLSTAKFDVNKYPDGVWGEFAPGVRIKVRKLTTEVLSEIRKRCTTIDMQLNPATRQMVPVEKLDKDLYEKSITDYLIEDFEGIGDESGNELPVTLESKLHISKPLALNDWIWAFAQVLDTSYRAKTEAEAKNSGTSPQCGQAAGENV